MTEAGLATRSEVVDVVPGVDGSQMASDYLGSLSVPDVLGRPDSTDEGLQFDTAHVFRVGDKERKTLELRFGGEPIQDERFLDLLEAVAPVPLGLRLGQANRKADDILDDWRIYERDNPNMDRLLSAHSGLKGWDELGKEYLDLKGALEPVADHELLPWMMPGEEKIIKPADFIENWGTAGLLANYDPLVSGADFVQLLDDVYGADETRERIIKAMKNIEPGKIQKGDPDFANTDDEGLFDLFSNMDIETRNRLVSVSSIQSTYRSGGGRHWSRSEKTEKFTELYLYRHCVTFETEDGQLMYAHGISPDFDMEQAYADRTRTYFGIDRMNMHGLDRGSPFEYETMTVDTLIGKKEAIIPGSVKFQKLGLVPTVRWALGSDGKRMRKILPEHRPLTSYRQNVLSNAAGLMTLAYLQPQRRRHWREEGRLPGIKPTQEMGPAQVPLIALQQSSRLLNNDLMREAEALAQA